MIWPVMLLIRAHWIDAGIGVLIPKSSSRTNSEWFRSHKKTFPSSLADKKAENAREEARVVTGRLCPNRHMTGCKSMVLGPGTTVHIATVQSVPAVINVLP